MDRTSRSRVAAALAAGLLMLGLAAAAQGASLDDLPGCENPSEAGTDLFEAFFGKGSPEACEKICGFGSKACLAAGKAHLKCGSGLTKLSTKSLEIACKDPALNGGDRETCFAPIAAGLAEFKVLFRAEKTAIKLECAEQHLDCLESCVP